MKKTLLIAAVAGTLASAAWAGGAKYDPDYYAKEKVRAIAHELEKSAYRTYRAAKREFYGPSYGEREALWTFRELNHRARRFHRQVEGYYHDPYRLQSDYRALRRAFRNARREAHCLDARAAAYRNFYRVERLMSDLRHYYGSSYYADKAVRGERHAYPGRDRYPSWFKVSPPHVDIDIGW